MTFRTSKSKRGAEVNMAINKDKAATLERFYNRETLIGTSFDLGSPAVVEAAKLTPLDWCVLDWEHALWNEISLPIAIQSLYDSPMLCIVRVPHLNGPYIKKALDWGADGVIVPNVHGVEEAKFAIEEAKYVPLGHRGVGPYRPSKNYTQLDPYVKAGNHDCLLWFMLEQNDLVDELDEVCQMEGVDGFIVGRNDLSQSTGKFYSEQSEFVDALAEKAMMTCVKHGKSVGIFSGDPKEVLRWADMGVNLLTIGDDAEFIREGMASVAEKLKGKPVERVEKDY